jgi:hypothetical protein
MLYDTYPWSVPVGSLITYNLAQSPSWLHLDHWREDKTALSASLYDNSTSQNRWHRSWSKAEFCKLVWLWGVGWRNRPNNYDYLLIGYHTHTHTQNTQMYTIFIIFGIAHNIIILKLIMKLQAPTYNFGWVIAAPSPSSHTHTHTDLADWSWLYIPWHIS